MSPRQELAARALFLTFRQCVIMVLKALDTYGLEMGWIKNKAAPMETANDPTRAN